MGGRRHAGVPGMVVVGQPCVLSRPVLASFAVVREQLLVDDLELLTYRLFMDMLEYLGGEFRTHAA